jgi:hypothetical protein
MPKIDRSVSGSVIRAFRDYTGLTQRELGVCLGCTDESVLSYEREGAPQWMQYALFGIAVGELGLDVHMMTQLLKITPAGPVLELYPESASGRVFRAEKRSSNH